MKMSTMVVDSSTNNQRWMNQAMAECIIRGTTDFITSDTLLRKIGPPRHSNVVGAFFRWATQSGLLVPVGRVKSMRPEARGRSIALYRLS